MDVWLDVACLFKTRSDTQKACRAGRVAVNGQAAKPHRLVRVGDEIVLTRGPGGKQTVIVRGLAERHVSKAEARQLYEDRTPRPSEEEKEQRRFERRLHALQTPKQRPDRRERRELRRLKGR